MNILSALGANLGKVILGQPTAIRWLIASARGLKLTIERRSMLPSRFTTSTS